MSRHEASKEKESDIASFSKGIEDVECKSIFGQYTVQEMITRLKGLALDPCMPRFALENIQPLWNQILRLRKFMLREDSEMPWRKRKLEQLVKDKMRAPAAFVTPNKTKRRRELPEPPSLSWLLNSIDYAQSRVQKSLSESHTSSSLVTFDEALSQKQVTTRCSFADDVVELNRPSKAQPSVVDSDESVNGSNPSSPVDLLRNEVCRIGVSNVVHNLNSPAKRRRLKLEPSDRLLFIEDSLQRKAMPVGPRFQADIPEWDDTSDTSVLFDAYRNDSNGSNWLGTRVWPIETGRIKSGNKRVGKGRPNSCSCASRGSTDCTKRHVLDEKLLLQRELGPAFSSWKFEEMGEQAVSESWSLKEQHTFETMMKKKPPSNGKAFWNRASKSLPRKSRKDIVHYYFNVYIPNRMSSGWRSLSVKWVDTDDEDEDENEEDEDEDENVASIGLLKRVERSPTIPKKKAKYLLGS